jgi:hypothetical protein
LGPSHHTRDVELHYACPDERRRDRAGGNALRETLGYCCLANPRVADERGAVLGPAAEDAEELFLEAFAGDAYQNALRERKKACHLGKQHAVIHQAMKSQRKILSYIIIILSTAAICD